MPLTTRRIAAACLAISLATTGCISRSHPKMAMTSNLTLATGAVLLAVGVGIAGSKPECKNDEGCIVFGIPGEAVLLLGAMMGLLTDVASLDSLAAPPEAPPPPPPPSPPVALPPLPTLTTDAATLALARQARMAALHGQCTAVRVDLGAIAHRDAAYHDALAAQAEFATCR